MKLITAIIPPNNLEDTKSELGSVGVFRLTVTDCQGLSNSKHGEDPQQSAAEAYGHTQPAAKPFIKIMIAVNEDFLEPSIRAILRAAPPEKHGDQLGRIFVSPLEEVIRIRTGERGPGAI